jgi:hypothetical protein
VREILSLAILPDTTEVKIASLEALLELGR